jgi:adenosylmethionine-8-amino-7-oxononanoate aminotransferase
LGIDRWSVEPDLVTLAKGVTGGALPLGALLVAEHVAAPFFTGHAGAPVLRHGATYAGHPTCCAAALAALDIYERDGLIERGRTLEEPLAATLNVLADHPLVADVRAGIGFLGAVELRGEALAAAPDAVARWTKACRAEGVLARGLGRGVAVSPPLTIGEDDLATIGPALRRALDAVAAGLRPA